MIFLHATPDRRYAYPTGNLKFKRVLSMQISYINSFFSIYEPLKLGILFITAVFLCGLYM